LLVACSRKVDAEILQNDIKKKKKKGVLIFTFDSAQMKIIYKFYSGKRRCMVCAHLSFSSEQLLGVDALQLSSIISLIIKN